MQIEAPAQRRLRRSALAAVLANVGIVITGGIVRVTGSGLGCPDWPRCEGTSVTPSMSSEHAGWQAFIEFGNRLLTFVVLAAVVAVVVALRRAHPEARRLRRLAWLLPAGVAVQAGLGGVTVLTGLSPLTVAAHFLLSMGLIAVAVAVHERVRPPPPDATPPPRGIQHLTTVLLVAAFAVLVLGTIVTGAGPHGGDVGAARLPVDIRLAAIAHADAVWLLVGLTTALMVATWRSGPDRLRRSAQALLAVEVLQGGIGYLQYATQIPPALVSLHITGAAVVWGVAVTAWVRARPNTRTAREVLVKPAPT